MPLWRTSTVNQPFYIGQRDGRSSQTSPSLSTAITRQWASTRTWSSAARFSTCATKTEGASLTFAQTTLPSTSNTEYATGPTTSIARMHHSGTTSTNSPTSPTLPRASQTYKWMKSERLSECL
ncbi:hypothetical protein J437_LFUL000238 [Ladona fulva]|uniref:Uncharacterized protein n=1 Tax=Ladona fulva TaxID=123851 RepID=A0A8K0JZ41_LADFU|nr:hypothetical protein J437_LFUL000238 [Ladona fulva]